MKPPTLELPAPWSAHRLTGSPDEGASLSHWMNQPYLRETWDQGWPPERWTAELRRHRAQGHTHPFLIRHERREFAYIEVYRLLDSPIAPFYRWTPDDLGFHIAVLNPGLTGRGLGVTFVKHMREALFRQYPGMRHLAGEPEVTNHPCRKMLERVGLRQFKIVELPHKKAALYIGDRPGDTGTGTATPRHRESEALHSAEV
ncbi:GNAT family N-acetyltransferase [Streptomyces coerulescens]|uniref:GNAT family N-acetyltransferase n=1 Tax=Streptomyces coerulescens TaxID=29304 RepID=A0ABW0CX01_STRCD